MREKSIELEIALYLTDDATEVQIDLWFSWQPLPDNYTLRFNADIITLPGSPLLGMALRAIGGIFPKVKLA